MKQDSRSQFRKIRDDKMEDALKDAKKKVVISKAESCIDKIEYFIKREIEKGKTLEEAIKTVQENKSINRTYSQLNDYKVKALVFNTIRGREKMREKNKNNKDVNDKEL